MITQHIIDTINEPLLNVLAVVIYLNIYSYINLDLLFRI